MLRRTARRAFNLRDWGEREQLPPQSAHFLQIYDGIKIVRPDWTVDANVTDRKPLRTHMQARHAGWRPGDLHPFLVDLQQAMPTVTLSPSTAPQFDVVFYDNVRVTVSVGLTGVTANDVVTADNEPDRIMLRSSLGCDCDAFIKSLRDEAVEAAPRAYDAIVDRADVPVECIPPIIYWFVLCDQIAQQRDPMLKYPEGIKVVATQRFHNNYLQDLPNPMIPEENLAYHPAAVAASRMFSSGAGNCVAPRHEELLRALAQEPAIMPGDEVPSEMEWAARHYENQQRMEEMQQRYSKRTESRRGFMSRWFGIGR